jgi:hypothetical protein
MFRHFIPEINKDIQRTKRAIIAIGCSFVQGHGAIKEDIYNRYEWNIPVLGQVNITWNMSPDEMKTLVSEYPDVRINEFTKELDFFTHEYNNSFVSVLAKKYFNNDFAAINLGRSGNGNRASIKDLYYYPDIHWNDIEECIVIYCPTGPERFDFITDAYHAPNDHARWVSIWPNALSENEGSKKLMWEGYKQHIYSEKQQVLEQIANIQELLLWCKYKNAKLIIVPGFMRNVYTKKNFYYSINRTITRDLSGNKVSTEPSREMISGVAEMITMWPWENMYEPDQCPTFMDLVMKQEFPDSYDGDIFFYQYIGKGSPKQWVTPCCHPSAKGHDVFASYLYSEIEKNISKYHLNHRRIGNL